MLACSKLTFSPVRAIREVGGTYGEGFFGLRCLGNLAVMFSLRVHSFRCHFWGGLWKSRVFFVLAYEWFPEDECCAIFSSVLAIDCICKEYRITVCMVWLRLNEMQHQTSI